MRPTNRSSQLEKTALSLNCIVTNGKPEERSKVQIYNNDMFLASQTRVFSFSFCHGLLLYETLGADSVSETSVLKTKLRTEFSQHSTEFSSVSD